MNEMIGHLLAMNEMIGQMLAMNEMTGQKTNIKKYYLISIIINKHGAATLWINLWQESVVHLVFK